MCTFWDSVMTLSVHVAQGFSWGTITTAQNSSLSLSPPFLSFCISLYPLPSLSLYFLSLPSLLAFYFPSLFSFPSTASEMTYIVSSGALNPTPTNQSFPSQKDDVHGRASMTRDEEDHEQSLIPGDYSPFMHDWKANAFYYRHSVIDGRIKR